MNSNTQLNSHETVPFKDHFSAVYCSPHDAIEAVLVPILEIVGLNYLDKMLFLRFLW